MKYIILILLVGTLFSQDTVELKQHSQISGISISHVQDMKTFIEGAVKMLVDKPNEVKVNTVETEQRVIYELTVGEGDYGKVIGKRGRNISALRTLVFSINAKVGGKRARLDIIDN